MRNRTINAIKSFGYGQLAEAGAAGGQSNRARFIPSRKEKARDARRQRKAQCWRKDWF